MIIVLLHTQLGKFKHKKTGDPLLKEDLLSDVSFSGCENFASYALHIRFISYKTQCLAELLTTTYSG